MTNIDLRELAIDRSGADASRVQTRRHLVTRYVLPLALLFGFFALVAWASRDLIFPPKSVTVVPVFSTTADVGQGTPLFNAAGWIEPRPTPVRVAALAAGVVEQLLVVEDQAVKAGEPIAELVKDDARLVHQRAVADLELRQAEQQEAKAGLAGAEIRLQQPVHLQAALGEAEASLARIQTKLKNLPFEIRRAEADHDAMRKIYEGKLAAKEVVAGVQVKIAESKAASAKALVEELRDRSTSLEKEQTALIRSRDALQQQLQLLTDETKARDEASARVRAAAARLQQARVFVAEASLQLERMTVVAPIDGRVFRLIAHPGARIGGGITQAPKHDSSTVVILYRPEMLQVRVDVRFEDLPKVRLNQSVEIQNPALSAPLTGKVLFISSEADIQKNTLQVKVEIPDPPTVLKPEMLVDVTFLNPMSSDDGQGTTGRVTRVFVPRQLVVSDGETAFVWLADQSARAARRQRVTVGTVSDRGLIEISDGLNASSRLIATGTDGLTDGCRIHITGEGPSFDEN